MIQNMYTIYINEVPLVICSKETEQQLDYDKTAFITHHYDRGRKGLFNYIDAFEKSSDRQGVILTVENVEETFKQFCSIYTIIEAAGGLVFNKEKKLLAIFRRGNWDLPKGKIEKGETLQDAAVREVQEETGIQKIKLKKKIGVTYHTYATKKNKRVLKVSHWYKMKTKDTDLVPQTEEDIEKVEWVNIYDFAEDFKPIYNNITDIIFKYLFSKKKA